MCRCIVLTTGCPLGQLLCIFDMALFMLDSLISDTVRCPQACSSHFCPRLRVRHFSKSPDCFLWEMMEETKVWELRVATGLELVASTFSAGS